MPTATQGTVEIITSTRGLGTSSTADTKSLFPGSPIHAENLTREVIRNQYKQIVLNAVINDKGHTFGTFSTSYTDAPNITSDVETGGEGLPGSPHLPNPVSPGEGTVNPAKQVAAPEGFGTERSDIPGSGDGSALEPSESSVKIAALDIDNLTLGVGSDG